MRIVALLTCHNRRDTTIRCLTALFSQSLDVRAPQVEAVVVDDGSSDGTGEAVRRHFPAVRVVEGDGTLFWARGMQLAETTARTDPPDFLLWLNDDVVLDVDAVERLLATASARPDALVVGALRDPETGEVTYSGVRLSRWHPLRVTRVEPRGEVVQADTFNGNVVLVPRRSYERLGHIDGSFSHGQADFDYGLRAIREGFPVVVAPGTVGTCRRGGVRGTFQDTSLSFRQRWRFVQSPTGLPMRSHARYLQRHGGWLWPIFWLAPYLKLSVGALLRAPLRRRRRGAA